MLASDQNSGSTASPLKKLQQLMQPLTAWAVILGFVLFVTLVIVGGAGKILNVVFPAGALAIGAFLYFRAPLLYVGFNWWLWFLTPLIRRFADYRGGGFTDPSPILLAPYLVGLVSLITLLKHLPKTYRQEGLPFIMAFTGVLYGFLVGLIYRKPNIVGIALIDWLIPVLMGFHLFANWRDYPKYRQNLERVFVWGVLVMGAYGVFQFLVAPEWDKFWLTNAAIKSAGLPEPLGIRVWSTLNSPEPFAAVMAAGLLVLFGSQSIMRLPASIVGYLAFLLSLVRAGWVGWLVGLVSLASSGRPKLQFRLILTVLVMAVGVVPLTTIEPFSDVINERVASLSDVENDGSANIRKATFARLIDDALASYLGEGIGGMTHDSAILMSLFNLGWFGIFFYYGGMLLLLFKLFYQTEGRLDPFVGVARAVVLSALIRFAVNVPMLESSGAVLWVFLGLGVAALKHHQARSTQT